MAILTINPEFDVALDQELLTLVGEILDAGLHIELSADSTMDYRKILLKTEDGSEQIIWRDRACIPLNSAICFALTVAHFTFKTTDTQSLSKHFMNEFIHIQTVKVDGFTQMIKCNLPDEEGLFCLNKSR